MGETGAQGVGSLLRGALLRFGDRTAFAERVGEAWIETSYAQLAARIEAVAGGLHARGVRSGDRVAIAGEAGARWSAALLAALRLGAAAVPIDTKLTQRELERILRCASPKLMIDCDGSERPSWVPLELLERERGPSPEHDWREDECALIVATSGTTGEAREVRLPWRSLMHQVAELGRAMRVSDDDVFVSILPPSHLLGLVCGLLTPLGHGSEFVHAPSLLPHEVARIARERRATRALVVPMFLALLAKHLRRTKLRDEFGARFRAFHCGGAALEPALADELDRAEAEVLVGYGLTEAGPVIATNAFDAKRAGSVGRPLPRVDVRIEGGEILVRGPNVMLGYGGDAQAGVLEDDGWLHTGDLGHVDGDGFLFVTGRRKELIVLPSGCKVQPDEVERVLGASPLIREACVFARSVDAREIVEAAVVASDEALLASNGDARELEAAVRAEVERLQRDLASHKRPERIHVMRVPFPRTPSGKILRREVARSIEQDEEAG